MPLDASATLDQLSRKRVALEQLLALAHQLSRMQGGMGMVQQMLKPSQAPGRKVSTIEQFCTQMEAHTNAQLQDKLAVLDRLIARELSSVVVLAHLTQAQFIQRYCETKGAADAVELLEKQLTDFRRNGQLNVAIRYVLHHRGVRLKAAELPISQEAVAKRIAALRDEEQSCRQNLKRGAQDLLLEIDAVLDNPAASDELKETYTATKSGLEQTLQLLADGRGLETLPLNIATAGIEASAASASTKTPTSNNAAPARKTASNKNSAATAKKAPPPRRSFWQKLRLWLNTPWRTRWKDLDSHR